jgi:hypothetical protein
VPVTRIPARWEPTGRRTVGVEMPPASWETERTCASLAPSACPTRSRSLPSGLYLSPCPPAIFRYRMTGTSAFPELSRQFDAEYRAKQRAYVLSNTRARWRLIAVGVLLLGAVRVFGIVAVPWLFLAGFSIGSAAAARLSGPCTSS